MDERKITSKSTQEILETIVQLADLLDTEALDQIADIPFLELAKAISINRFERRGVKIGRQVARPGRGAQSPLCQYE
jgi:hypothetical protein